MSEFLRNAQFAALGVFTGIASESSIKLMETGDRELSYSQFFKNRLISLAGVSIAASADCLTTEGFPGYTAGFIGGVLLRAAGEKVINKAMSNITERVKDAFETVQATVEVAVDLASLLKIMAYNQMPSLPFTPLGAPLAKWPDMPYMEMDENNWLRVEYDVDPEYYTEDFEVIDNLEEEDVEEETGRYKAGNNWGIKFNEDGIVRDRGIEIFTNKN